MSFLSKIKCLFLVFLMTLVACHGRGRTCVPAGTMVATPSGEVPIEQLKIGDEVISYDDANRAENIGVVVETFVHEGHDSLYELTLRDGTLLRATGDHLLYLKDSSNWARVNSLQIHGTLLVRGDGEEVVANKILSIELIKTNEKVYNIDVRSPVGVSWFAEGILTSFY